MAVVEREYAGADQPAEPERRRLGHLAGWRCLEVGAAEGSMSRWLSDRQGDVMVAPDEKSNLATSGEPRPQTRLRKLAAEVREHPIAYTVLALFMVAGPVVATLLFPEAPPAATIIGGLAFGGYAALCAVPGKFL